MISPNFLFPKLEKCLRKDPGRSVSELKFFNESFLISEYKFDGKSNRVAFGKCLELVIGSNNENTKHFKLYCSIV